MSSELLSPDEWEQLVDTVSQPAARVPLCVVGGTGLPAAEFLHLHEDWIEWPEDHPTAPDHPIIHIPESEQCRRKKVQRGHNSSIELVERNEPCSTCKDRHVSESKFIRRREGLPNTVPVVDSQAVDALTWWFKQYDTIPWQRAYTTLNTVAKNRLDREINHTALRRTFFARAAKMGLDLELISASAGTKQETLKEHGRKTREILSTYGDYNLTGEALSYQNYLKALNTLGPATVSEIADKVDRARVTVLQNLNQYANEGLVKEIRQTKTGAKVWKATASPTAEIKCRHTGCERTFSRLQDRTQHEKEEHE